MGIEQIQLAKTKALLSAFQFNWSQMESSSDTRPPKLPMSHFFGSIQFECHNRLKEGS